MEFARRMLSALSGGGQAENQAWGWTGPGPLEGPREQAPTAVSSLLGHHWGFLFPERVSLAQNSHLLVTLIDSSIRISGERRGTVFKG